jgi:hypothetical protein
LSFLVIGKLSFTTHFIAILSLLQYRHHPPVLASDRKKTNFKRGNEIKDLIGSFFSFFFFTPQACFESIVLFKRGRIQDEATSSKGPVGIDAGAAHPVSADTRQQRNPTKRVERG